MQSAPAQPKQERHRYMTRQKEHRWDTPYNRAFLISLGDWRDDQDIIKDYKAKCPVESVVIHTAAELKAFLALENEAGIKAKNYLAEYKDEHDVILLNSHGDLVTGELIEKNSSFRMTPEQLVDFLLKACPKVQHLKVKNLSCYGGTSKFSDRFHAQVKQTIHLVSEVTLIGSDLQATVGRKDDSTLVEDNVLGERTLVHTVLKPSVSPAVEANAETISVQPTSSTFQTDNAVKPQRWFWRTPPSGLPEEQSAAQPVLAVVQPVLVTNPSTIKSQLLQLVLSQKWRLDPAIEKMRKIAEAGNQQVELTDQEGMQIFCKMLAEPSTYFSRLIKQKLEGLGILKNANVRQIFTDCHKDCYSVDKLINYILFLHEKGLCESMMMKSYFHCWQQLGSGDISKEMAEAKTEETIRKLFISEICKPLVKLFGMTAENLKESLTEIISKCQGFVFNDYQLIYNELLRQVAVLGSMDRVQVLLDEKADVAGTDVNGNTVLHCDLRDMPMSEANRFVKAIISRDEKLVDRRNDKAMTPLESALLEHKNFFIAAAILKIKPPSQQELAAIITKMLVAAVGVANPSMQMLLCLRLGFPDLIGENNREVIDDYIRNHLDQLDRAYPAAAVYFDLNMCRRFVAIYPREHERSPITMPKSLQMVGEKTNADKEIKSLDDVTEIMLTFPLTDVQSTAPVDLIQKAFAEAKLDSKQKMIDAIWNAVYEKVAMEPKKSDRYSHTIKYLLLQGATVHLYQYPVVSFTINDIVKHRKDQLPLKDTSDAIKTSCQQNVGQLGRVSFNKKSEFKNNESRSVRIWQHLRTEKSSKEMQMFFLLFIQQVDSALPQNIVETAIAGIVNYPEIRTHLIEMLQLQQSIDIRGKIFADIDVKLRYCQNKTLDNLMKERQLFFKFLNEHPVEKEIFCAARKAVAKLWPIVIGSETEKLLPASPQQMEQLMAPRNLGLLPGNNANGMPVFSVDTPRAGPGQGRK